MGSVDGADPDLDASVTKVFKSKCAQSSRHQKRLSRHGEMVKLDSRLQEVGLMRFLIPGDGDCLYGALAHQLTLRSQKTAQPQDVKRRIFTRMKQEPSYKELFEPEVQMDFGSFDEYVRIKEVTGRQGRG